MRIEEAGIVFVSGSATAFLQKVVVGRHCLSSDEPVSSGGTDGGPGPYDLLLAALGSCTSMTVGAYARRKGIPLVSVAVRLRHEKVCSEATNGLVDRIERAIHLEGPLSADERARLLEIAERCPVHRTLTSKIEIVTQLAETLASQPSLATA